MIHLLLFLLMLPFVVQADGKNPFITGINRDAVLPQEAFYQYDWCDSHNGKIDVTLQNGTQADCITSTHAVEVAFANRWAEGLGQSLHYAMFSGKRAAVLLVLGKDETIFQARLQSTINHYGLPVDVFTVAK